MSTANGKRPFAILAALALGVLAGSTSAQSAGASTNYLEKWQAIGPNVRMMSHQDGSRTQFRRSPDERTLTKRTRGPNGVVKMVAVYRMDKNGNPRGCQIFDGRNNLLFKVSYGYHRVHGQLVAEDMFDARVKRIDPSTGKETPVRRMYYTYDAQGNQSKPIVIVPVKGRTAEAVFGGRSTFPHDNPFKTQSVNPRAKPVGE
ncbi:MAG: hypothetical protein HKN82_19465 [Akkermansiaceae bacterium]|nr:hypothetical protein [Akkermansiaceae bacterium]